jgi:hypothetical protein
MKLHEIQCHFREVPHAVTKYRLRRRPSSLYNSDFEDEDENEKNQIRSHAYALRFFLFSAFRIPTSEFLTPDWTLFGLRVMGCGLRVTSCALRVTSYGLRAKGQSA